MAAESPPRLRPDRLPEMIGVGQAPGPNADCVWSRQQIEASEFPDGVRKSVDADAERLHFGRRFQNGALNPAPVEHEPQG